MQINYITLHYIKHTYVLIDSTHFGTYLKSCYIIRKSKTAKTNNASLLRSECKINYPSLTYCSPCHIQRSKCPTFNPRFIAPFTQFYMQCLLQHVATLKGDHKAKYLLNHIKSSAKLRHRFLIH
jgi:hypothetical protein